MDYNTQQRDPFVKSAHDEMMDNHPSIRTEGISPEAYIQSIKEDFN